MAELKEISIDGIDCQKNLLWLAAPEERLVATYDPASKKMERKLVYPREVWDVSVGEGGFWMLAAGGKLGRQVVFWSEEENAERYRFDCPDGAASGITLLDGKLWLAHRHNRKLFCLDSRSGKTNWVIRTEHETFSPSAYQRELWLIESEPGPLGHWGETRQAKYFFSRYDPARERIVERHAVPFVPRCMAFDGARFWYAEDGKKGLSSAKKNFR
jgi:hypothetical protein